MFLIFQIQARSQQTSDIRKFLVKREEPAPMARTKCSVSKAGSTVVPKTRPPEKRQRSLRQLDLPLEAHERPPKRAALRRGSAAAAAAETAFLSEPSAKRPRKASAAAAAATAAAAAAEAAATAEPGAVPAEAFSFTALLNAPLDVAMAMVAARRSAEHEAGSAVVVKASRAKKAKAKVSEAPPNPLLVITDAQAGILSFSDFVKSLAVKDPVQPRETWVVLNRVLQKLERVLDPTRQCSSLTSREIAEVKVIREAARMIKPVPHNLEAAEALVEKLWDLYEIDCRPPEPPDVDGNVGLNVLETMYKEHVEFGQMNRVRLLQNMRNILAPAAKPRATTSGFDEADV
jgi:hypothetical protein